MTVNYKFEIVDRNGVTEKIINAITKDRSDCETVSRVIQLKNPGRHIKLKTITKNPDE